MLGDSHRPANTDAIRLDDHLRDFHQRFDAESR